MAEVHVRFDLLGPKPTHLSPSWIEDYFPRLHVPIPGGQVCALEREIEPFLRLSDLLLGSACAR